MAWIRTVSEAAAGDELAELCDRDVLEIAEVTAGYAYVNRIADGLGVEIEPGSAE
jgi:hypothetical protein